MPRSLALLPLALTLGCSHAQTAASTLPAAPPPAPVAAVAPAPAAPMAAMPRSCGADDQCAANELCVRSTCTAITAALEECSVNRVHFDFDQDLIRDQDRPLLQRVARCLGADRNVHVVIEGNADERGTVEYNLHLGDRRATAVARYLEGLGVPQAQLATVTYGKELPLCVAHDEACWAENRRVAVVPNGQAKDIARLEKLDARAGQASAHEKVVHATPGTPSPAKAEASAGR